MMATAITLFGMLWGLVSTDAAPASPVPATTEAVVKSWASGTAIPDILETIRSAPTAFELDPAIIDELRAAGFPDELLQAMQRRNRALRHEGRSAATHEPMEGATLRVRLNPGREKAKNRRLRLYDELDPALVNQWNLRSMERPRFSDVAVFVACSTVDHVPDQWRHKTPLRWNSREMPRHRMLALQAGAAWGEATALSRFGLGQPKILTTEDGNPARGGAPAGTQRLGMLVYDVPRVLETQLAPGVAHDLHLGVALKVGDQFYPWTITSLKDVVVDEDGLEFDARIRGLANPSIDAIDIEFADQLQRKYRSRTICRRGCPVRP